MRRTIIGLLCAMGTSAVASAAEFEVRNPVEFQAALSTAQSNGQNDTINVQPCTGDGCTGSVYNIAATLTYTSTSAETFSLTINGLDSDTRILDGGGAVQILRIDTTAANSFADIIVNGITFRNGLAAGVGMQDGGALAIIAGTERIELRGSVFHDNVAEGDGGAAFVRLEDFGESPVQIFDTTFARNQALGLDEDGAGDGGGALIQAPGVIPVEIFDTEFLDNTAATNGGGLVIQGPSPMDNPSAGFTVLFDTLFDDNEAQDGSGGGAFVTAIGVDLQVSGFVNNEADGSGGGLYTTGFTTFGMTNTGFAFNAAGADGGGFAAESGFGASMLVVNNTIFRNAAGIDGGGADVIVSGSTGLARLYNNIIHSNTLAAAGEGSDISIDNDPFADIPAVVEFFNNDISSLTGFPDASDSFRIIASGDLSAGGNIDATPILPDIEGADNDPSQGQGSPTIDAGLTTAFGRPMTDFEGDPRPMDGDGDGTATVDIGMDEFVPGAMPSADLVVRRVASPDPVESGEELTYTITVGNNGPDPATNVVLTETLDMDLTLVSASFSNGGTCTQPLNVECAIGGLAVDEDIVVTILTTAPDVTMVQDLFSMASVTADENDPEPGNNAAASETQVVPVGPPMADLASSITDNPDPVFAGSGDLTYIITADNNGPDTATAVTLGVDVPVDAVTFRSAMASAGVCGTPDGMGRLTCNLDDLAATNNATVTVVVTPNDVAEPTRRVLTATLTGAEEDPDTGNNDSGEETTINPASADLAVTVGASPAEPAVNEEVTFSVAASSAGPSIASATRLVIALPAEDSGAELISFSPGAPTCQLADNALDCDLGDLETNATETIEIVVMAPAAAALLEVGATVMSEVDDPDTGNNVGNREVQVIDVIALVIQGKGGAGAISWLELAMMMGALAATARAWARTSTAPAGSAQTSIAGSLQRRCARTGGAVSARARGTARPLVAALLSTAALLVVLAAGNAVANDTGWYTGAALGQASANYSESDLTGDLTARGWTVTDPAVDDNDLAWKVYGGYALNSFLALEASWVDLGVVETRFGASVPPNQVDEILGDTVAIHPTLGSGANLAGVLRYEVVPERLSLHARAGVFVWRADIDVAVVSGATSSATDDSNGTDLMYGLGLEWRLTPNWSLTGEWERYRLNDWVDAPMIGVKYRFGN